MRHILAAARCIMDDMPQQEIADSRSTLAHLLKGAKRKGSAARIRTSFVQIPLGDANKTRPGPLAQLVKHHDQLALDLYLLFMALASAPPYDVTRDARFWARALGLVYQTGEHNTGAISKAWARLEKLGLISRARKGNFASITPRPESGDAPPEIGYVPPAGGRDDLYFRLPFEYWLADDALHDRLNLREKAMLLICLSRLKPTFTLTAENAAKWYGVAPETAQKALKGLVDKGVLLATRSRRVAPGAAAGFTYDIHYRMTPPFTRPRRSSETASPTEGAAES